MKVNNPRSRMYNLSGSLRSKRFQSSYCAKVRAEAKKRLKEEGEGKRLLRRLKNEKLLN